MMLRHVHLALGAALTTGLAPASAEAPMRQVKGAQIRQLFAGREFTDEKHWTEHYKADGTLAGTSMGRGLAKRWRVAADLLCVTDDKAPADTEADCREVWTSGGKVELRRPGGDDFPKEGILRKSR